MNKRLLKMITIVGVIASLIVPSAMIFAEDDGTTWVDGSGFGANIASYVNGESYPTGAYTHGDDINVETDVYIGSESNKKPGTRELSIKGIQGTSDAGIQLAQFKAKDKTYDSYLTADTWYDFSEYNHHLDAWANDLDREIKVAFSQDGIYEFTQSFLFDEDEVGIRIKRYFVIKDGTYTVLMNEPETTTEATTEAPTEETTEAPTESTTVEPTTEAPTESTTVEPTTEAPTAETTTVAPETTKVTPTTTAKATTKKITLGKVKLKKPKNKKKRSVLLRWKKVKNAKKYQVQYSKSKKFKKAKSKYTKKLKIKIKKLKKKKQYYFRVRAINGKVKGKWSKKKRVKIKR
ncbi:MAG: fibronectin type III domain-containing protein [Eubacterium sp.]|nr:fibronectin type III domain-containing protein [Eubacterium sp.]